MYTRLFSVVEEIPDTPPVRQRVLEVIPSNDTVMVNVGSMFAVHVYSTKEYGDTAKTPHELPITGVALNFTCPPTAQYNGISWDSATVNVDPDETVVLPKIKVGLSDFAVTDLKRPLFSLSFRALEVCQSVFTGPFLIAGALNAVYWKASWTAWQKVEMVKRRIVTTRYNGEWIVEEFNCPAGGE